MPGRSVEVGALLESCDFIQLLISILNEQQNKAAERALQSSILSEFETALNLLCGVYLGSEIDRLPVSAIELFERIDNASEAAAAIMRGEFRQSELLQLRHTLCQRQSARYAGLKPGAGSTQASAKVSTVDLIGSDNEVVKTAFTQSDLNSWLQKIYALNEQLAEFSREY